MCRTDESGAVTTVELIDIDDDSVAAETELEGEWTVQQQSLCDKRIALCDREHNMWQLLSPDLADLGTVKVETCDGYFSYDAKSYYFLRDDVLCRTELESGETTAVELDYDLRFLDIAAFDASGSRMLAHFYLSPYSSKCGSAIFDPDSRRWTYYSGGDEGVYFVDGYSRTFASEDRARIMEFFMTRDDDAQELIKSPAIKKKLQHMSSAVRSAFDDSGWENVRWERFL